MEEYIVTASKLSGCVVGLVLLLFVVWQIAGDVMKLRDNDRD